MLTLVAFAPGLGLGAMLAASRALAKKQRHEDADMHERASAPLAPGTARVVSGVVALDGDAKVAVDVAIEQRVKNHRNKSSRWHTWDEQSRTVRASPFYLEGPDRQPVYVVPNEDVLVLDAIETRYPNDTPLQRLRVSEVSAGETVLALGELTRGPHPRAHSAYREGVGWILRPPRSGRMLLATEVVRDRYAKRVTYLRNWALGLAVVYLVTNAFFTAPMTAASLFGVPDHGVIVADRAYVTHDKHGAHTHWEVTARTADGLQIDTDTSQWTWQSVHEARRRGDEGIVPMVRVGTWEAASFIGRVPWVSVMWPIFGTVGWLAAALALWTGYQTRLAWYDRKKLNERGGSGYWNETRPHAPVAVEKS